MVAERGLGLTPLIFLAPGLMFVLTTITYVEGGAMFHERGGSSMFARYAFNELVSFIAGWAILIDFLIIIAARGALGPALPDADLREPGGGRAGARGRGRGDRLRWRCSTCSASPGGAASGRWRCSRSPTCCVQLALIVVGVFVVWHPERLTDSSTSPGSPASADVVYAAVLAMIAYAGIEAAANLAPDLDLRRRRPAAGRRARRPVRAADLRGDGARGADGGAGRRRAGGSRDGAWRTNTSRRRCVGVVSAYEPGWIADVMRMLVAVVAAPVLFWAANSVDARPLPPRLHARDEPPDPELARQARAGHQTPHVAILIAAVIAIGLVLPTDIEFLAGLYAFGAMLATTIAHFAIIRLRVTDPDREAPVRDPVLDSASAGAAAAAGGGRRRSSPGSRSSACSLYHDEARWVGGGWMLFGLFAYVIYRRVVEETSLTERVTVHAAGADEADQAGRVPPHPGARSSAPTSTTTSSAPPGGWPRRATRTAAARKRPLVELVYVVEVPLTLPLDAPLPADVRRRRTPPWRGRWT